MLPRTIGSLFSGIGGLELGLERALGAEVLWQCESDLFARRVLRKHWPDVTRFHDVRYVGARCPRVDLICGGFPCQDVSSAGAGAGLAGARSGLWFEFARVVDELSPGWVVVENVASGATRWVDAVRTELAWLGYDSLPVPIEAADVGAPHERARIFIVAHAHRKRRKRRGGPVEDAPGRTESALCDSGTRSDGYGDGDGESAGPRHAEMARVSSFHGATSTWPALAELRGVDDGLPDRLDRLRCLGNAVVPLCAEVVGHVIAQLSDPRARPAP